MAPDRRVIALGVALVAGCAASTAARREPPEAAVRAYGEALAGGDAARTMGLELEIAHRGRDLEGQRAAMERARAELAAMGTVIAATDPARLRAHARIPLADGETVVLAREGDGSWRIEGGPIGAPALVSARDAVAALRSALVRRDLRAIEEVLAQRTRAAWERAVARVLDETEDPDALEIEIQGERARVITPDGAIIELSRESEEWRVLDVRPAP